MFEYENFFLIQDFLFDVATFIICNSAVYKRSPAEYETTKRPVDTHSWMIAKI